MTATLEPAGVLVPLEDVRRHLGYPRGDLARQLRAAAAAHGLHLEVRGDWAGRPCVPEAEARTLVAAVTVAREQAAADKRRRNRDGEVQAYALQQRCEQRANLCFQLALEKFGDPSVAIKLAHQAASQAVADEDLTRQFEAAGVRWEQGFRTLAPEPGRADRDPGADVDSVIGRDWLRSHGLDALDQPIPPPAAKRLREVLRGRTR